MVPGSGDLVAVAMPPSERWLEIVRDAWEVGAAILPVDHRLPPDGATALSLAGLPSFQTPPQYASAQISSRRVTPIGTS